MTMTCHDCGYRVRPESMVTQQICSSCAQHPGWRHETTTRRIMREMRRKRLKEAA